jgi:uncharacterized protein YggE
MKTIAFPLLLAITAATPASAQYPWESRAAGGPPHISVNGEAVVYVKPDKIVVRLGIETDDKDVNAAKQKNSEILKDALTVIKGNGVADRDIQTDHLSLEPRWRDEYRRKEFLGYRVRNSLSATLSDVAKLEAIITQLLAAGVNYIHGIDFQTTQFKKHREEARQLALKAAKEKAEKMAVTLGQTIGAPLTINEGYGGSGSWYYSSWSGWGYGRGDGMGQNVQVQMSRDTGGAGEDTEGVALGKLGIRASVSVTFELTK